MVAPAKSPARPGPAPAFSGRAFAIIIVAFFGVVVAVNITMARLAQNTFGGTVVDNSYVASQKFNGWLEQARTQDRLGWVTPLRLDTARHVVLGVPGPGFSVQGTAHHPLGRAADVPLVFVAERNGDLRSATALPAGRWQIKLIIRQGTATKRIADILA